MLAFSKVSCQPELINLAKIIDEQCILEREWFPIFHHLWANFGYDNSVDSGDEDRGYRACYK